MEIDQPEPRHQIIWALYWLFGTLGCVFVAGCVLDVGMILALPIIGFVSLVGWLALTVKGIRSALEARRYRLRCVMTASASVIVAIVASFIFWPVVWASGFIQAEGVLALNIGGYQREIERSAAKGAISEPLMWSYGGWLSMERVIAYWPSGNPDQRLMAKIGGGSYASCRWLRPSFYDCTIVY